MPHPGPRPGVGRILLGRVWIPSAPSEVLHPSHPRTPGGNLFFKQGISVRAGTPIELVVPNAFRGDVSVDFAAGPVPGASSLGEGENAIFVEPCPADSQGPWTAFSGGFLSRRLICAALVVRVEGRTERLPIGLGKRCWKTGRAMFQALTETLQVTFNDSVTPPTATWKDVSPLLTSVDTLDPILFTDPATGRTFVSQLYLACSLMAFSDDDGGTWIQNPLGCGPGAAVDHQTVGGGPFAPPLSNPVYPHAVYYCAQAIAEAACAESVTGGATFGPGVPMYTLFACGGLHGHIKVGPDGTAYVPNADCGGQQGFALSTDNGATWNVRTVPDSSTQDESDPSVGIASDGTVYFGYADGDGHPRIAVSRDKGVSWSTPVDVGVPFGIENTQFPAVVAGDGDRAAFAFLGTPTPGDDQSAGFTGVWHLYVAYTYDRGLTWTTVDATPNDPVQRGCIWLGGGSNPCRNLLDFMDATVDAQGRVLVGFADGCVGTCVTTGGPSSSRASKATISRQTAGEGLFASGHAPGT